MIVFSDLTDGVEAAHPVLQGRDVGPGSCRLLLVKPDEAGHLDWQLSIDSTVTRVHQRGLNLPREVAWQLPSHTAQGDAST